MPSAAHSSALGAAIATPVTRQTLVPGTYKPSVSTTGLLPGYTKEMLTKIDPSDPRCRQQGSLPCKHFYPDSNTVYENIWFHVPVRASTAVNVTFRNCYFDGYGIPNEFDGGTSTDWACFDASESATAGATNNVDDNFTLEDCEINAYSPNDSVNGIRGCGFTVRRSKLINVVDGIDIFQMQAGAMHIYLEAIYIDQLTYFNTPGNHADNRTHNDCVQWAGGSNWRAFGCTFNALAWPASASGPDADPYYPAVTGQGIGVTSNAGPCSGMDLESCWLDGGNHAITAIVTSNTATYTNVGSMKNLKFGRNSHTSPVQISNSMTFTAINLTYEDNGSPVTVVRGEV